MTQTTSKEMVWQPFDLDTIAKSAWKNGGGVTRELACWPQGASMADFAWRVSVADIAQAGPFSLFADTDRHLLLLQGEGVHLHSKQGNVDTVLHANDRVLSFSGDVDMDSKLVAGAVTDFNVMTKRGQWQAQVTVLQQGALVHSEVGLVLVSAGQWQCEIGSQEMRLNAGQGVWWHGVQTDMRLKVQESGARLLLVQLKAV